MGSLVEPKKNGHVFKAEPTGSGQIESLHHKQITILRQPERRCFQPGKTGHFDWITRPKKTCAVTTFGSQLLFIVVHKIGQGFEVNSAVNNIKRHAQC